jgi:hypothetical protein
VPECDREVSIMRRPRPTGGCYAMLNKVIFTKDADVKRGGGGGRVFSRYGHNCINIKTGIKRSCKPPSHSGCRLYKYKLPTISKNRKL